MKLPSKTLERKLLADYDYVVGVDEVGVGCLAGPVVVGAVVLDKKFFLKPHRKLRGLRDSKLLSEKQRETYAGELIKSGLRYQMALCQPKTIDRLNIYQAARLAMRRAISKLVLNQRRTGGIVLQFFVEGSNSWRGTHKVGRQRVGIAVVGDKSDVKNKPTRPSLGTLLEKTVVLVDGKTKIKGLPFDQQAIVKGDRKVFAIACASILAKVYRDKMMAGYAKHFPRYGFEKHKGYGTKLHLARLAHFGPCSIHRRSFAPVARLL